MTPTHTFPSVLRPRYMFFNFLLHTSHGCVICPQAYQAHVQIWTHHFLP
jgi:hypothetical protein